MKTKVFLTFDVEHSIGGAFENDKLKPVPAERRIFCNIDGRGYGLPLSIRTLNAHKLKGNFFVETLNIHYFGTKEVSKIIKYLRGHDVLLHLHSCYLNFKNENILRHKDGRLKFSDSIADYSLDKQKKLILDGKKILAKNKISPIGYRSGNYSHNSDTYKALEYNKIRISSNYNQYINGDSRKLNDLVKIGSVFEFPITNFVNPKFGKTEYKPLEISSGSFSEMKKVLKESLKKGPKHVVFQMHPFNFVKHKDIQYKDIKPDWIVIRRFEKLCKYLDENRNKFEVLTFSEWYKKYSKEKIESVHNFPCVGWYRSLPRKIIQAINSFYFV